MRLGKFYNEQIKPTLNNLLVALLSKLAENSLNDATKHEQNQSQNQSEQNTK